MALHDSVLSNTAARLLILCTMRCVPTAPAYATDMTQRAGTLCLPARGLMTNKVCGPFGRTASVECPIIVTPQVVSPHFGLC